ncbi:hypothetical protein LTR99_001927 [Exophiala xenobiotica]|uniref:Uncharacterized protein n=1 Tax=Vermiconidia calcicola TaxID=1690605 RepID=A0AAV9Q644_9PEZI|nr:hypothetical protein H2202_009356 [Exophiala xenobiotica]KAK5536695.1 hypothetical protein LTR25_005369 [Vermiconidia calcicola]KAK5540407.1 hypothetical protein LTR23_006292 [Chaetothyriales sp. CCFEE 6169]KAK5195405.1 hypothetical protein LTR92_004344 [Exophiala xenobiotica]KAK5211970.1 hypothetical protein LTR41_002212 [Exophiala xenobiotica]
MCFRTEEPDPTQQPIRITRSDEAHGGESFGDGDMSSAQDHAPAVVRDKHGDRHWDNSTQTQMLNAKVVRKTKANDRDIADKMATHSPNFFGAPAGF